MESWLRESGVIGLDDLKLVSFPATGRGVSSLRPFKEGDRVITVPGSILWTVEHAYTDSLLGPVLRSLKQPLSVDDTLVTYILFVRSRNSGYDGRRSHVEALPRAYSSSIFFTEDELEICVGSSLYTITKQLKQQIQDDYRILVERVFEPYGHLFPMEKFTIEDYKWALCTIWSRAMDFVVAGGKSIRLMSPFADMLNHSLDVKQCHVYDPTSGNLSILAGTDYEPGDQIFINYGPIPNNRLLRLYGFVVPNNPNDSYDLILSTHPEAPFYEQKQKLWTLVGLDSISTISLTIDDPLPKRLLQYLRIQRANQMDLSLIELQHIHAANEILGQSNEMEVLRALIESFNGLLHNFRIQMEKLEEQIKDGFYPLGTNKWSAAHVSFGEQKVLRLAKKRAEDLLIEFERHRTDSDFSALMQCGNCAKVSVPLMLCERCKAVRYCGRTCQVAHYKAHKTICKAMAYKIRPEVT